MLIFSKKKLYQLIAFFTTLVIIVTMGIYSYYIYVEREKSLFNSMNQDSQTTLQSLQKNIGHLIEAYAVNEYDLLIENEMHRDNFSSIIIEDYNMAEILNKTTYVTGKIKSTNGIVQNYNPKDSNHNKLLDTCHYLQSSDIFSSSDKKIGFISICSTDKIINKELNTLLFQNIFVSIIFSLLLSLTLFIILRRFAITPISHILETLSEQDSDGMPKTRIHEFGSFELSILSKKINFLLDSISQYRVKEEKIIAELNMERERLSYAIQGSNDGLWDWNIQTNEVFFSPRWKEILGYRDDELENDFAIWETLIHPDDGKLFWIEFERFLASKDTEDRFSMNFRMRHKDGHYIPILSRAKKAFDEKNETLRLVGTHVDLTELTAVQDAYKEERDRSELYLDTAEVLLVALDTNARVTMLNRKGEELLGYKEEELLGKVWFEIGVLPEDIALNIKSVFSEFINMQEVPTKELEHHLITKSGEKLMFSFRTSFLFDNDKKCIGLLSSGMDITQKVKAEEELVKQHTHLSSQYNLINNIINTVPSCIFWKDKDGIYLGANKLFLDDAHLKSPDELIGKNDFEMPWGKTEAQLYRDDDLSVMNGLEKRINIEESQTDEEGHVITLLTSKVPLIDDSGTIGVLGTYVDITQQRNTEDELKKQKDILYYQAHHDSLTGLPNKVLFNDRLEKAIEAAKRNNTKIALLFIDLDHFKEINDSLGHNFGDEILRNVSNRLREVMRDKDTISRFGGDEFIVVLEELSQVQDASLIANKILDSLSKAIIIGDNTLYVPCSIGISIYPDDGVSTQNLLKFADSAMYKAKDEGRNNYQYYNSTMTELAFERVLMETSLRAALENEEFVVFYQPQVNGATDKLIGMEALVRWQHPTMGLVPPDKFIPLAESTGLIVELDRYVMKTAMTQLSQWYKTGLNPGRLAINLAVKQLKQEDFIETLQKLIHETSCLPDWLELEVTEGQIMANPEEAIKTLQEISDLGIELAIDDFGTGYSSLAYLKKLPIDKLKIDQAFVRELPDDDEDAGITKAVIALAYSLNLKVIAEGVETKEQRDFLVENGCQNIQGYFYSKPIPAAEIEVLLKNGMNV